jgi:integration host factor subunit beta
MEKRDGDAPNANGRAVLTRLDLLKRISAAVDLTLKEAEVVMETILNSIVHALDAGDKVEIRHFGSFRMRQRNARVGRNPKTGARVEVPAKRVPYFTPSKELKAGLADLTTRLVELDSKPGAQGKTPELT